MPHKIKSILENICQEVWQESDLNKAKTIVINFIESRNIKDIDKKRMKQTVDVIVSKRKLDQYIANSLLQFEGMSVVKAFATKSKDDSHIEKVTEQI